jgi:mannose-1-phosphate guanylyltransferase
LYAPQVYEKSKIAWEKSVEGVIDFEASMQIPSISVDYAVMEKSKKIKVVSSEFIWSDLGSFESVYEYLVSIGHPVDKYRNMVIGTEKYTAFIGMKDTIFIYTDSAHLILQKEFSQDVKSLYGTLERENPALLD